MSANEINKAVAEICGWECVDFYIGESKHPMGILKGKFTGKRGPGTWMFEIPNYCNDLNAMHDAELFLTYSEIQRYTRLLLEKTVGFLDVYEGDKVYGRRPTISEMFSLCYAAARQRAEVFLVVKR